jgi:hypothetical protein
MKMLLHVAPRVCGMKENVQAPSLNMVSENPIQIQENITLFTWAFGRDYTSAQNLEKRTMQNVKSALYCINGSTLN